MKTQFLISIILSALVVIPQAARAESAPIESLLQLSIEELLEQKITSVSRQETTVGHAAAAVFVITEEMIRRSGATVIPELFRMVPGMNVSRIDGNKWAVSARGFNQRFGDKLLVMVDGRTVYNPLFSGVYWDAIDYPLEDIQQIEVIRGPGASMWGANAVNGVINIVTKDVDNTQGTLLSSGGGSEERGFITARHGGGGEDLAYRVFGKAFTRDELNAVGGGDAHDGWDGGSGGVRVDWDSDENNTFMFDAGLTRSIAEREDFRPQVTSPFIFQNQESENTSDGHILSRWEHTISSTSKTAVQLDWSHFDRESSNGVSGLRWDTYNIDFQHTFLLAEHHQAIYGLNYRVIDAFLDSSIDDGFITSFPPAALAPQLFSAFLQDEISIVPERFAITIGSKFEHNDFTGFEVQPTIRGIWTPSETQTVWAAISRAVRTPNLSERGLTTTLLPVATDPTAIFPRLSRDPSFDSEQLLAYELGGRTMLATDLTIDIAFFYYDYDDLRTNETGALEPGPVPGTAILPIHVVNKMEGESYGFELAVTKKIIEGWNVSGAYSYLEMHLNPDAGIPDTAKAPEDQSPEQQFYIRSAFDLPYDLELDLIGRFIDTVSGFNVSGGGGVPNTVNDYISLDTRLAWRPMEELELTVVGQNLLDSDHVEAGSASLRAPIVEIPRGVYAKATLVW